MGIHKINLLNTYTESDLFRFSIWWRIAYGTLRIVVGLVSLKLVSVPFTDLLYKVMSYELQEDPADLLFHLVNSFLELHPFTITYFMAGYFIFWGFVDVVLSYNLLRERLWAFPVSLVFIGFFVIYELYRFTHTHSLTLLFVIGIDVLIFWLITREYRKQSFKSSLPANSVK